MGRLAPVGIIVGGSAGIRGGHSEGSATEERYTSREGQVARITVCVLHDENQEIESRRLIEFCGLTWDEQCLNFAETERAVQTPSKWQVRQPIYRSSVGGWKKYGDHLGPLEDALAE